MANVPKVLYLLVLLSQPVMAERVFPVAPADVSKAVEAGLQRLDTTDLAEAFSGQHSEQGARGKSYRAEYGADGSVVLSDSSGLIDRGTFTIVRQNGGGVCLRLEQQMNQRMCAIWFFSEDGINLFGYNPRDGALHGVSRADER